MDRFLKSILLVSAIILTPFFVGAQDNHSAGVQDKPLTQAPDAMLYLEKTFPQLTELYRDELKKYPAHYIFAVDVSGTMNQYANMVVGSLAPFFEALPNGDRVDVIPFGTQALPNLVSYSGEIDNAIRTALKNNLPRLYNDPTYAQGFKSYTDIESAINAIAKVIQTNRNYKINVVIILTDFRNDVQGDKPSEHKFNEEQLTAMKRQITAATNGSYLRSVALELPVDPSAPGYCLPQLKNSVFLTEGTGLEIVPMSNPGSMISQWFDQLKRDIMVTKLRAIVDLENKTQPIELETKIDIDGNVKANVHWTPSKLYPKMRIDSTYVDGRGFYFVNNKKNYKETSDSDLKLRLGKIKHKSAGMHHFNDSIHLGLSLPTPYDDELTSLGISKPLPNTSTNANKWIWTFPLPFWLCCLLIALIIAYICWVFNAMRRNGKYKINADVLFFDAEGESIEDKRRIKVRNVNGFKAGRGGNNRCNITDAEWQLEVNRVKSNPFLPWTKPHIEWHASQGKVNHNRRTSGQLDRNTRTNVRRISCFNMDGEKTHMVSIEIKQG